MTNIVFVGAGSVRFTLKIISDLAKTPELSHSSISLMDIDETRLDAVHKLAQRLTKELGSGLSFEKTTELDSALEGADFVINTTLARGEGYEDGYHQYEEMRAVGNKHGYYRGIDAQDFNRVSDYFTFTNYNQLKLALNIAQSMEDICPNAWLLNTSNPVFEITQLIKRETDINILGLCHGFKDAYALFEELDLDLAQVDWQIAGVNHGIWLNRFQYQGEDAYPLIDEWIEKHASDWSPEDPWDYQLSPVAVDMYQFYNVFPINDTIRNSTWKYHHNLGTKKRWYGKFGGIDNNHQRPKYYEKLRKRKRDLIELAKDPAQKVVEELELGGELSGEQHLPIINALVNDKETRIFPNILNKGIIEGIPGNVVVEVPAKIDKEGVYPEDIEPDVPDRVKKMYLRPRILRMEWALEAFQTGDREVLEEVLVRDPRTKSFEQVKAVWDEILDLPFNKEMKEHYSEKS